MDMHSYISERLRLMKDGNGREQLREVLEEVFLPLCQYTEEKYHQLEERILNELPVQTAEYCICSTIAERESAKQISPYLFPVLDTDCDWEFPGIEDMKEALSKSQTVCLETVFIKDDYLICREIERSNRIFKGNLQVGGKSYPIDVMLKPAHRYIQRINNLYQQFCANGIPWRTVNITYFSKFFDVILVRMPPELHHTDDSTIASYHFEKYSGVIHRNMIPVWNIKQVHLTSEDFPLPAQDKVNYEYHFDLTDLGTESGYLADYNSAEISATRREKDKFIITTPVQSGLEWDLSQIVGRRHYNTEKFDYPLLTNQQRDSFAEKMISHYATTIKTVAELVRLTESFALSSYIKLEDVRISQRKLPGETYEMNPFIEDQIRDQSAKKTMMLRFNAGGEMQYITRDCASFLTSQVQLVYPEYKCIGVVV